LNRVAVQVAAIDRYKTVGNHYAGVIGVHGDIAGSQEFHLARGECRHQHRFQHTYVIACQDDRPFTREVLHAADFQAGEQRDEQPCRAA